MVEPEGLLLLALLLLALLLPLPGAAPELLGEDEQALSPMDTAAATEISATALGRRIIRNLSLKKRVHRIANMIHWPISSGFAASAARSLVSGPRVAQS